MLDLNIDEGVNKFFDLEPEYFFVILRPIFGSHRLGWAINMTISYSYLLGDFMLMFYMNQNMSEVVIECSLPFAVY